RFQASAHAHRAADEGESYGNCAECDEVSTCTSSSISTLAVECLLRALSFLHPLPPAIACNALLSLVSIVAAIHSAKVFDNCAHPARRVPRRARTPRPRPRATLSSPYATTSSRTSSTTPSRFRPRGRRRASSRAEEPMARSSSSPRRRRTRTSLQTR
ncbi:hypothetical protein L227DRAFT_632199, partial [Lentinus tigrinus ALCF2SS1-6]